MNKVYLLDNLDESKGTEHVAVFKTGHPISSSLECIIYDLSLLFGLGESVLPTKLKTINGMQGSIQIFQNSKLGTEVMHEHRSKLKEELFDKVPLRNLIFGALPGILFGNRDLHTANYFLVKENDEYRIVVFDNELSFPSNNRVIKWINNETWLPVRCCLLDYPQADTPITGELLQELRELSKTWDNALDQFYNYLYSHVSMKKFSPFPLRSFSKNQVLAFEERVYGLKKLFEKESLTLRDIVYNIYPCYRPFYQLTKKLYPKKTAEWVGYLSCESLCKEAVESGILEQKNANEFISNMARLIKIKY